MKLLVILDGNPVFTAPADLDFGAALKKVPTRVHVGLFDDETAALCHWHVPSTHFLEEWSDARAHDGTASIVQPLIAPLYQGRSLHEVVAVFSARPERTGLDLVKEYWQAQPQAARPGLREVLAQVAARRRDRRHRARRRRPSARRRCRRPPAAAEAARGYEIAFAPDPTIYDGRFANNGWLQELPKPLTKITWDNAVLLSPATAAKLQRAATAMASRSPGRAGRSTRRSGCSPGTPPTRSPCTSAYGRTRAGRVGNGVGYNGYAIRTSDAPWPSAPARSSQDRRRPS